MKQRNAEILLIIVIASRSISYLLSKIGLNGIPPLELLAIRFALTTLILLLLFHRRLPLLTRQLWKAAGLLGTFLFACMACELISLTTIPSSTAAFLENTSAVWVLILMAVVSHHWPGKQVLTATSLLLIGIACLTLQGAVFHLAPGEIICLTGSVFYALWICLTARLARQYDPLLLGILQMGFLAVYSTAGMVLFESPAVPADTTTWGAIYDDVGCHPGPGLHLFRLWLHLPARRPKVYQRRKSRPVYSTEPAHRRRPGRHFPGRNLYARPISRSHLYPPGHHHRPASRKISLQNA